MPRPSPPKPHRTFDGEQFDFYKAFESEKIANEIAESMRHSNHYGTFYGVKARVFHIPHSQAYVEYIFNQPHYYRWAVYTRAYKLPESEAKSRTAMHNMIHEAGQVDYINLHYDKMLDDLYDDRNYVIRQKLIMIIHSLKLPWQTPSKYTPTQKKAILNAYRTAKWVSR